jgi:PIN domain nuclease of toxin-antitoxin system
VAEVPFERYGLPGKRLVLDTHVWIGYLDPEAYAIPSAALRRLDDAQRVGGLLVPEPCVWEVALKAGRGSLQLAMPVRQWVERALQAPGMRTVPFGVELMLRSAELPSDAVADPFDRAIIATALALGAPLVTGDRAILRWAAGRGGLEVVPAARRR